MAVLDIFNPQISVVAQGLEGKKILIYGDNGSGKTFQSVRAKNSLLLGFETGIEAIAGVSFLPINAWSEFKKLNRQLTGKSTVEKAKEMYQTIIFDEVYTAALMCELYVCSKYDAEHIGEQAPPGVNRPNLYKEYEKEWLEEFNKLTKAGYTVVFIGHTTIDNESKQIIPKGDKRSMQVVRDNCTICAYVENNGLDENGNPLKSSAYFNATPKFFARSRLEHIVPMIEEFTIENLEKAVSDAVKAEEKAKGIASVTHEEYQASITGEKLDFAELKNEIKTLVGQLSQTKGKEEGAAILTKVIEEHLGKGRSLKDTSEDQVEQLSLVAYDLKEIIAEQ